VLSIVVAQVISQVNSAIGVSIINRPHEVDSLSVQHGEVHADTSIW
jgi:hypothetical protein